MTLSYEVENSLKAALGVLTSDAFTSNGRSWLDRARVVQPILRNPVGGKANPDKLGNWAIGLPFLWVERKRVSDGDLLNRRLRVANGRDLAIHLPTTFGALLVQPRMRSGIIGHPENYTDEIIFSAMNICRRSRLNKTSPERSTAMSTNPQKQVSSQSTVTPIKAVEPAKAPESPTTAVAEAPKTETPATPDDPKNAKTIVSISVDPKLARQGRLLAKCRGVSISSLFVEAAAKEIPRALKAALAEMQDEVE